MIELCDEALVGELIDFDQVTNHARGRVDLATENDLEPIIMSVAKGIVALPEDLAVALVTETVYVKTMRGAEAIAATEVGFHASPI
jgi:hypothetical protein